MCSIVGYIGNNKCLPILINGLKKQEYRGCDSLGIAYFENNHITSIKTVGKIEDLEKKVDFSTHSYIGIGHTRWATHGIVNEINCHPHTTNNITIVHNGIIENYLELKKFLIEKNYTFYSDTDTEIACSYIDYEYRNSDTKDMVEILNKCLDKFVGSYAIAIMVKDINNKLFLIKKDSPLMILKNDNEYFISSDIKAFSSEANSYISLDDLDIGIISNNNVIIYNRNEKKDINFKEFELEKISNNELGKYKHHMLKEINEQINLVTKWNSYYLNNLDSLINLEISAFDIKFQSYVMIPNILRDVLKYNVWHLTQKAVDKFNNRDIILEKKEERHGFVKVYESVIVDLSLKPPYAFAQPSITINSYETNYDVAQERMLELRSRYESLKREQREYRIEELYLKSSIDEIEDESQHITEDDEEELCLENSAKVQNKKIEETLEKYMKLCEEVEKVRKSLNIYRKSLCLYKNSIYKEVSHALLEEYHIPHEEGKDLVKTLPWITIRKKSL